MRCLHVVSGVSMVGLQWTLAPGAGNIQWKSWSSVKQNMYNSVSVGEHGEFSSSSVIGLEKTMASPARRKISCALPGKSRNNNSQISKQHFL